MKTTAKIKATVFYRNGQKEETMNFILLSENSWICITNSGIYIPGEYGIKKYYPELTEVELYADGRVKYDNEDCWLVDNEIEKIDYEWIKQGDNEQWI